MTLVLSACGGGGHLQLDAIDSDGSNGDNVAVIGDYVGIYEVANLAVTMRTTSGFAPSYHDSASGRIEIVMEGGD